MKMVCLLLYGIAGRLSFARALTLDPEPPSPTVNSTN